MDMRYEASVAACIDSGWERFGETDALLVIEAPPAGMAPRRGEGNRRGVQAQLQMQAMDDAPVLAMRQMPLTPTGGTLACIP
ncbi:MAG: hypothetical protein P8M32_04660, partial [Phycisphaerales bacterium]|nr:hypothetical protein [Phycisphaerales bacterium]